MKKRYSGMVVIFIIGWICLGLAPDPVEGASCKVLVVMSYEEDNPWVQEIKAGVNPVLEDYCNIKYFYMDTKKAPKAGPEKGKEAYELYRKFQPDGVIAADDNAQSLFVVPFLKEKVQTPVMFCGVNAEPEKYGYPASNVSGILERNHTRQSIAFAKQLLPSIKTVGFLARNSPSGKAILNYTKNESGTYLAKLTEFKLVDTLQETLVSVEELKGKVDILITEATNGIPDEKGRPMNNKQVIQFIRKAFGKPLIGGNRFHVEYGALVAVIKTGQTQGKKAAEMLLRAMQGTQFSQLPITVNKYGRRMLNVSVMKSLGIKPNFRALIGTELITTIK